MLASSQSIAYLQTLQEPERNNPMAANRDALSRRSTTTLSHKKMKVYKPTPSMKQLGMQQQHSQHAELWTVEEDQIDQMIERATGGAAADKKHQAILSESEDESSSEEEEEYGNEEERHSVKEQDDDGKFKAQDEVMVTRNNIQCIVQGGGGKQ